MVVQERLRMNESGKVLACGMGNVRCTSVSAVELWGREP